MKPAIFSIEHWYNKTFDGRKKIFRGISRDDFKAAVKKHYEHRATAITCRSEYERRREIIRFFATIPYKYEGDGWTITICSNALQAMGAAMWQSVRAKVQTISTPTSRWW